MTFKIAVPIIGPTEEDALRDIRTAVDQGADLIEIRRDYFTDTPNLQKLADHTGISNIFTCRHRDEAGPDPRAGFKGSEEKRKALYEEAAYVGFKYLDIEHEHFINLYPSLKKPSIIRSYHDFNETPDRRKLVEKVKEIEKERHDIVKLATVAQTPLDSLNMLSLVDKVSNESWYTGFAPGVIGTKRVSKKILGICMEQYGVPTRVLGPYYGNEWTFASLDKGKASAPGQLSIKQLRDIWKTMELK